MTDSVTLSVVSIIPQIGQIPLVGYLADTVVFINSAEHNFMHKTYTNTSTQSSYVARCAVILDNASSHRNEKIKEESAF
jgi:hypothetical protein